MQGIKRIFIFFLLCCCCSRLSAQSLENEDLLIKRGWNFLVVDNDSAAITCFELAYEKAIKENNPGQKATALLYLGISYYGVSYTKGTEYCFMAMAEFKKLEQHDSQKALVGRSRCLQLLSTIYSRQEKYKEAIRLSTEALAGFPVNDKSGYRGLIFTSLANAYEQTGLLDSAAYYNQEALTEQLTAGNFVYLPAAYVNVADMELNNGYNKQSETLYRRAMHIADSTGNQQGKVIALLGLARWEAVVGKKDSASILSGLAQQTAAALKDKSFYLKVLEQQYAFKKKDGDYQSALHYREEINTVKDTIYSEDKRKLAKSLEVQFNVAEKDRKLVILQKEKDIVELSNYLLWISVIFILFLSAAIIFFLRKTNARNKLLVQAKEALVAALEEQTRIRERFLQQELEFKESQLNAMALQMLEKNLLLEEIRQKLEKKESESTQDELNLQKMIGQKLNQDKDWAEFNLSFESLHKDFYLKLREAYPGISSNDLKICALIKLNLSTKEMAGILNISPDSVKTARYRLRKKLQLSTENNLAEFVSTL
ncbi:MAG: hypothetical protein JWP12_2611 [Bacteroidetes bacterium]|nr:hypothetical protein [Bacteroidota bacterium]